MTAVHFDSHTGRLRLDERTFDTLTRWAQGVDDSGSAMADLREAGVVERDRPHPKLTASLAAIRDPVCRLRFDMTDQDGHEEAGEGWIASGCAALLLDLPRGLRELVSLNPTFLPAGLARIVRLGPRPRQPEASVELRAARFDELLAAEPDVRRGAAEALRVDGLAAGTHDWLELLVAAPWSVWKAETAWSAPGGTSASRALRVADTQGGLLRIDTRLDTVALAPTTPTAVWRELTLLLPGDDELG